MDVGVLPFRRGDGMIHVSQVAQDVLQPPDVIPFICDPLIPAQGVTFLHGPKSIGKSPFIWTLAHAVASQRHFLGMPCTQGCVLIVEVDSPKATVQRRLTGIKDIPPNWFVLWGHACNIMSPADPVRQAMQRANEEIKPDLVILNTLRKSHPADDKESAVPSLFYRQLELIFPDSARMVVHHDKKMSVDGGLAEQAHSGSEAWRNDAQSVIHLERSKKGTLRLVHTGSQVSETLDSLMVRLTAGNSLVELFDPQKERDQIVVDLFRAAKGESARQKAEVTSIDLIDLGITLSADRVRHIVAQNGA